MKKILIVSPHFPPVNAADMQRARLALPHLRAHGWEPVVLAVEPDSVEGAVLDPLLEQTYPPDVRVIRVKGFPHRVTRVLRFGSLWLRCRRALRQAGERLLATEPFDLIFFSTTQFGTFSLGPRWLRRFGVPYVLDYQDPWLNDYYRRTGVRPPGGRLRYWFAERSARRHEPAAVRSAAAIVSVSASYGPELLARYPNLDPFRIFHIPFGAAATDLDLARKHQPANPLIDFADGHLHFVYAGRCGPDMEVALSLVFKALRRHLDIAPNTATRLRLHFIGTGYAPPPLGRPSALPVALREGVADLVSEFWHRVPYFDALYYLTRADGLLVLGSDDPSYSASKIFPYLLARRPLLVITHRDSLMLELARDQGIKTCYGFGENDKPEDREMLITQIACDWFSGAGHGQVPLGNAEALLPHTAGGMTARLVTAFNQATQKREAN